MKILQKDKLLFTEKLAILQEMAQSTPNIDASPITSELNKISTQIKDAENQIGLIIKITNEIMKQKDNLLKDGKPVSLQQVFDKLINNHQNVQDKHKNQIQKLR